MQPKYRNPRDGFRPGSPFGRNRSRGGFSRSYSKPQSPPASKMEILMEAGRLAAEYLVSKGVLPASSLPSTMSKSGLQEFRGQGRENPSAPPPFSVGRTSALARLGDAGSDVGYGRKRFNDDYDRMGSRKNGRGRKRSGFYNRGYDGPDWGRERKRNGPWNERSRDYSDSMEEDNDDFAPGYRRDRLSGYEEVGSSIAENEQHSKGEVVGESGSELDDAGSKASSNSTRKDVPAEVDADENKGADEVLASNSEAGGVKSGKHDELEKKISTEEYSTVKPDGVEEGVSSVSNDGSDLLKLSGFPKVPTRPRSSLSHKGPTDDHCLSTDGGNKIEVVPKGDFEMVIDDVPTDGFLKESHVDHSDRLKCEEQANSGDVDIKSSKETIESPCEPQMNLLRSTSSAMMVDVGKEDKFANHVSQEEELEKQINSSSPTASQQNQFSQLDGSRQTQASLFMEMPPQSVEMEAIDQLKQVTANLPPKVEAQSFMEMEDVKQNQPTSFKICDLNLMEAPEITEIPSDPLLNDCNISAPPLETEKQLSVDFGLSINSKAKVTYDFNRLSGDDKVIPVIDLEDDSPIEVNACNPSKAKNELIYPVENVMNHTTHSDDLPVIQDSYSLAISDYLGADMSCSPSVQADLNNLQVGIDLHGAEGFPGVDDSIYGSLGDIGFMEVWDQPTQDYEKFF
ncbi:uncharacterized protein At4g26450 [Musa acuminata AAA Group]|uniref:uncharacterized protein At4g26450 n=1 Tax=Musa acuminata AAA Group TaxID=214697 RepID=UPI0031CEBEED